MYTLEQSETTLNNLDTAIVTGKGSDISKTTTFNRKAKNKCFTQKLMLKLIDAAKENSDDEMVQPYWNTYHCQEQLVTSNNRSYGKYCNNRFCLICCNNRKAKKINQYYPLIKKWEEPYFITLTIKACKANKLKYFLKLLKNTFSKITNKYRKQEQRGKGEKLVGIKSLECHYNSLNNTYQPHLHIIVANKEMATIIKREWLTRIKKSLISTRGQKVIKILKTEKNLINIIKYVCKIFSKSDLNNTINQSHASGHHNIIKAMKGIRIFDRFGFDSPKVTKKILSSSQVILDVETWEFYIELSDWINVKTNISLNDYVFIE